MPRTKEAYVISSKLSNSIGFASVTLYGDTNYLFYYNSDNTISCLSGTDSGVYSDTTIQPTVNVSISAGSISPLAAAAWEKGNENLEIRLYYVECGTDYIRELCSSDGKSWYSGRLDNENYKVASKGGGLSASYGEKQGLKVYFVDANNSSKFTEAYINTDTGRWSSRVLL